MGVVPSHPPISELFLRVSADARGCEEGLCVQIIVQPGKEGASWRGQMLERGKRAVGRGGGWWGRRGGERKGVVRPLVDGDFGRGKSKRIPGEEDLQKEGVYDGVLMERICERRG